MDEIVMYFVARKDLNMSAGKLATQVGHGVQYLLTRLEYDPTQTAWLTLWKNASSTKIVLAVENLEELHAIIKTLDASPVPSYARVIDEGRTEVAPKTETLLAIAPLPRSIAKPYVGHLRPL
jgi:peptidyl-tRNA hydrolase